MLEIHNLTITYKKDLRILLKNFTFNLNTGDKTVIIGEEGNGKSTLLKWIFDPAAIETYAEVQGTCIMNQESVGYLPQEMPKEDIDKSVYEYFCEEEFLCMRPDELHSLLHQTGLSSQLLYSDQKMGTLSGGEKVKVQIARLILSHPTVYLLDEPTNDLDIETLQWMEKWIQQAKESFLFVSHDETLIEHTADRIIHLELLKRKTENRCTAANMTYAAYCRQRTESFERNTQLAESERREDRNRMEKYRRIQQKVESDLRSISPQDPHGGYLLKKKMKAVKSIEKRYEKQRREMTVIPVQEEAVVFSFDDDCTIPTGKRVLEFHLDELRVPASDRILAKSIHLEIFGPQKICILGENGCGKTTLLRRIAAEMLIRTDIHAAYMPQNYEDLMDPDQTPVEYLSHSDQDSITSARMYLGAMRYTSDEMLHAIRNLSGGQKAKLMLLKLNLERANVLLLDEPTRNFSPLSAPVIRSVLKEFHGAIISVSHDRKYIRGVCGIVYHMDENGLHLMHSKV